MQYCIDFLYFDKGRVQIRGWAAPENIGPAPVLELLNGSGEAVPFFPEKTTRNDVSQYLWKTADEEQLGFLIKLKYDTSEPLWLHAYESENKSNEIRIELRKLYRHQNSFLTFLRTKDKKGFLLRRKCGDLPPEDMYYHEWYLRNRASKRELGKQRKEQAAFSLRPLISVLVPVYKPKPDQFEAMVRSVREQTYENWELCFADGSPEDSASSARLKALSEEDPRIRVLTLSVNGGISENTNAALQMAKGEFVSLLDQDDLYTPDALFEFVRALNKEPSAEILYSDEDKLDDETGVHMTPHFKPDFNPARLHSDNYICHLIMLKTELMRKIGGERKEYDGAQDFDLTLRAVRERTPGTPVVHISKVLYHWRIHEASTSGGMQAKTYAVDAGARAIRDAYEREGHPAELLPSPFSGRYITKPVLSETPLVSILIPNKDHKEDLLRCVGSILEKATYRNFEILIIENNSETEEIFETYEELQKRDGRIRAIRYEGGFNYAKINNFGAREAKGDYLLLLNNDTEVITPDFMESMLFYAMMPENGAVGAKLLYGDGTIQHAGVLVGVEGRVLHAYIGTPKEDPGYMGRLISTNNVSAVTGACLMTKKALYEALGGLTEEFAVAYNDVDYCLKARHAGLYSVYDAFAELYHFESRSRGYEDSPEKKARLEKEMELLRSRWPEALKRDPFYNDNLSLKRGFYLLP